MGKLEFTRAEEASKVSAFAHLVFPSDRALILLCQFKPSVMKGTFWYLHNFQTKIERRVVCTKVYKKGKEDGLIA